MAGSDGFTLYLLEGAIVIEIDSLPNLPWHRMFGLLLSDQLLESPFTVEMELDLSLRKQLLDIIVVRKQPGDVAVSLPDGLNELADHNLITFKSFHEPLNDWALKELTGHYVNYRKQVSPKGSLLPESVFRLFAVCARTPRELLDTVQYTEIAEGVYDCQRGTDSIRVIVARQLPLEQKNALIHLFSAAPPQVQYGREHFVLHSEMTSSIVDAVLQRYVREGIDMPYTMEDYRRELIQSIPVKDRVANLTLDEVLPNFTQKQIQEYIDKHFGKEIKPRAIQPKPKRKRKK